MKMVMAIYSDITQSEKLPVNGSVALTDWLTLNLFPAKSAFDFAEMNEWILLLNVHGGEYAY